jgi:hypothetical protein
MSPFEHGSGRGQHVRRDTDNELPRNGNERASWRQAVRCELSQRECAERLGIGVRQFKRLVRTWRNEGDTALVSRQRGQPSNSGPPELAGGIAAPDKAKCKQSLGGQH